MRKIIFALLILSPFYGFNQVFRQYFDLPNNHTRFGVILGYGQLIKLSDSIPARMYQVVHSNLHTTDSMTTMYRNHYVVSVGSAGGTLSESDPYYRADTAQIAYLNQENIFQRNQTMNYNLTVSRDLVLGGSFKSNVKTITKSRYDIIDGDNTILFNGLQDGKDDTIFLPDAASFSGYKFVIQKSGYDQVIIKTAGGLIYYDGGALNTDAYYIGEDIYYNLEFQSDHSDWYAIREEQQLIYH